MLKPVVLHRLRQFHDVYSNINLNISYKKLSRMNHEKMPLLLSCECPDSVFAKVVRPDAKFNTRSYDLVYNLSKNTPVYESFSPNDKLLCMYFPFEYRHLKWSNNNSVVNVHEENDGFVLEF